MPIHFNMVYAENPVKFVANVDSMLKLGWMLHGPAFKVDGLYHQCFYKN